MDDKELYINFDEYIRQGEPQKRERAEAWRVAIGLQAVDGTNPSTTRLVRVTEIIGRCQLPLPLTVH